MLSSPGRTRAVGGGLVVAAGLSGVLVDPVAAGSLRACIAVAVAVVALVTATRRPARRGAWWLIAIGLSTSAIGDLSWISHLLVTGSEPPSPWIADAAHLLAAVTIISGISFLVADVVPARRMSARLDIGVLSMAVSVGLWFLLAEDLVVSSELSPLALAVALTSALVDVGWLCILATLLLDPRPVTRSVRLLTGAVAATLIADFLHLSAQASDPSTAGGRSGLWTAVASALFALAILHPSSRRTVIVGGPPESLGRGRLALLWSAVVATAVTSTLAILPVGSRSAVIVTIGATIGGGATVLTATLVLWRLSLATRSLRETLAERGRLQQRLEHEANHDALTGLANRRRFAEASRGRSEDDGGAVIYIDLDRFKEVNDRFGHAAGDEVLRIVAARVVDALPSGDLVARLGGDEFAALLRDIPPEAVDAVAERILAVVRAPMVLSNGTEVRVDASVGTAAARADSRGPVDLLHDADAAMYEAKRAGRSRVTAYSSDVHHQVTERLELETDLEHAVSRGELSVVYQPLVAFEDRRPIGVEALARWEHPTRGPIRPDVFIPLAESSGCILEVGRWVLDEACRTIAALSSEPHGLQLSVNVSPVQLHHGGFAAAVEEVLATHRFDPRSLTLEITETVLLEDAPVVRSTVERLRGLGVRFAVDDFGTGYSALRYLRDVPLDELKIDRSFVVGMSDGPDAAAFVLALVNLARTFRLTTVAEGIETEDQFSALAAEGCDLGQGYLFARPLPAADLASWLSARRRDAALDGGPPGAVAHRGSTELSGVG